jgi:hypothetical protein
MALSGSSVILSAASLMRQYENLTRSMNILNIMGVRLSLGIRPRYRRRNKGGGLWALQNKRRRLQATSRCLNGEPVLEYRDSLSSDGLAERSRRRSLSPLTDCNPFPNKNWRSDYRHPKAKVDGAHIHMTLLVNIQHTSNSETRGHFGRFGQNMRYDCLLVPLHVRIVGYRRLLHPGTKVTCSRAQRLKQTQQEDNYPRTGCFVMCYIRCNICHKLFISKP